MTLFLIGTAKSLEGFHFESDRARTTRENTAPTFRWFMELGADHSLAIAEF